MVVVDLELDTSKEGCDDGGTTFCRCSGSKGRRVLPVICLSPDREVGASFQVLVFFSSLELISSLCFQDYRNYTLAYIHSFRKGDSI